MLPEEENLQIFPNPSSGIINLRGFDIKSIIVYNVLGELVCKKRINAIETEIDLNIYPKGIYFIEIHNGVSKIVKKVVHE